MTCTVHWSWMPFTLSLSTFKLGWTQVPPLSLQTTSNIPQVTGSQILVLVCRGDGGSEARWAAHQTGKQCTQLAIGITKHSLGFSLTFATTATDIQSSQPFLKCLVFTLGPALRMYIPTSPSHNPTPRSSYTSFGWCKVQPDTLSSTGAHTRNTSGQVCVCVPRTISVSLYR